MHRHAILVSVSCVLVLFTLSALPVAGIPAYQLDPTDQQATVDAIVDQRFTQTAIAITEAPPMPTTVSTVAPTPIPTLTLMPTTVADGNRPFFTGTSNTVFSYTVSEDVFDEYQDGWEEYWSLDYDDAIDAFSDAIDIDPAFAEAYYGRAISYITNGNINDGLADFATFESLTGRIDQGVLFWRVLANYPFDDEAVIADANILLSLPPFDASIVDILMLTYIDNEEYQEAIRIGDAMLPYFYFSADFFDARHDAYDELEDDDNADFNDLMHDGIDDLDSDDLSDAEDHFEEAVELAEDANLSATNLASAYWNLALVEVYRGDFDEALEYLDDSLDADSSFGTSHHFSGLLYGAQNDEDLAFFFYNQGIQLAPDFVVNYLARSAIFDGNDDQRFAASDIMQWVTRTQRHSVQWQGDDLIGEELTLPLSIGWNHQFVVDLSEGDELTITAQNITPSGNELNPLIVILDPSGEPLVGNIYENSNTDDAEIDNYEIEERGMYTIIIGNASENNNGLVEVEIEID